MDNLNDLKQLWQTADTGSLPNSAQMMQMVKKFRSQKLGKKLRVIVIAILLTAVMLTVMFFYSSSLIITRMGEVLMIAACGVLIFTNMRSMRRFYNLNDCSNKEFIEFLEQTRLNQVYYYKKTQVVGLLLSSAGLLLYLYEFVRRDVWLFIITYTLSAAYISVLWFVVRPRIFKRES